MTNSFEFTMPFRFLELPRELRDEIYRRLLMLPLLHGGLSQDTWDLRLRRECEYGTESEDDDDEESVSQLPQEVSDEEETEDEDQDEDGDNEEDSRVEQEAPEEINDCFRHNPIPVAILRTCRQLHDEASLILYQETAFSYGCPQEPPWIPPCSTDDHLPCSLMPLKIFACISKLQLNLCTGFEVSIFRSNGHQFVPYPKISPAEITCLVQFVARHVTSLEYLSIRFHVDNDTPARPSNLRCVLREIEDGLPEPICSLTKLKQFGIEHTESPSRNEKNITVQALERLTTVIAKRGGWRCEEVARQSNESMDKDPYVPYVPYLYRVDGFYHGGWLLRR